MVGDRSYSSPLKVWRKTANDSGWSTSITWMIGIFVHPIDMFHDSKKTKPLVDYASSRFPFWNLSTSWRMCNLVLETPWLTSPSGLKSPRLSQIFLCITPSLTMWRLPFWRAQPRCKVPLHVRQNWFEELLRLRRRRARFLWLDTPVAKLFTPQDWDDGRVWWMDEGSWNIKIRCFRYMSIVCIYVMYSIVQLIL